MEQDNNVTNIIKTSYAWLNTNIVFVIAPTALAYLYEWIAQEETPNLIKYYDSIILIIFSVSCNLLAVSSDNRSNSIKKILVQIIKKISRFSAIIYGGFHFYIIGNDEYVVKNGFLIFSLMILILFSILGCMFANHHTIYDVFIEYIQNKIINNSIKIKNKKERNFLWKKHH